MQSSLIECNLTSYHSGGGGNLHMSRYGYVPLFWVLFWGCSRIFGYVFGLFPDFWVSFFGYSRIFGYHFLAIPGFLGIIFW